MLARLYSDQRPISRLALLLTILTASLLAPAVFSVSNPWSGFAGEVWMKVFGSLLLLAIALLWGHTILEYELLKGNQYGPLFLVLFLLQAPAGHTLNPTLLGLIPAIMAQRRILELYETSFSHQRVFDSGLYLGLATLLDPHYLWWMLFLYLGIILMGQGNWRSLVIPFFGLFSVWMFVFTWYFLQDQGDLFAETYVLTPLRPGYSAIPDEAVPALVIFALALVPAFQEFLVATNRANNYRRQVLSQAVLALPVFLVVGLFTQVGLGKVMLWLAFPLSLLFANHFQYLKKEWNKDLQLVLLLAVLWLIPLLFRE